MEWLDLAKKLPTGHNVRFRHCGKDTAGVAYNNSDGYSFICHRCGEYGRESIGYLNYKELLNIRKRNEEAKIALTSSTVKLPYDFTHSIPSEGMLILLKASITPYMARQAGFGWTPRYQRVVLPVYDADEQLVYYQARAVLQGQTPKYLNPRIDRAPILYCRRHLSNINKSVIVTEDILSAERVYQAQTRADTVSILGTKITLQQANKLSKYAHVIMWLDSDKAGRSGDLKISKLLELTTRVSTICTPKDPKLLTNMQINCELDSVLKSTK